MISSEMLSVKNWRHIKETEDYVRNSPLMKQWIKITDFFWHLQIDEMEN